MSQINGPTNCDNCGGFIPTVKVRGGLAVFCRTDCRKAYYKSRPIRGCFRLWFNILLWGGMGMVLLINLAHELIIKKSDSEPQPQQETVMKEASSAPDRTTAGAAPVAQPVKSQGKLFERQELERSKLHQELQTKSDMLRSELEKLQNDQKPSGETLPLTTFVVDGLKSNDSLNVRTGPSAKHPVVATLFNGDRGIQIVGEPVQNGETLWVPVRLPDIAGWVNRRFLLKE